MDQRTLQLIHARVSALTASKLKTHGRIRLNECVKQQPQLQPQTTAAADNHTNGSFNSIPASATSSTPSSDPPPSSASTASTIVVSSTPASDASSHEFESIRLQFGSPMVEFQQIQFVCRIIQLPSTDTTKAGWSQVDKKFDLEYRVSDSQNISSLDVIIPFSVLFTSMPIQIQEYVASQFDLSTESIATILTSAQLRSWLPTLNDLLDIRGSVQQSTSSNQIRRILATQVHIIRSSSTTTAPDTSRELVTFERDVEQLYREQYFRNQFAPPAPAPTPNHPNSTASRTPSSVASSPYPSTTVKRNGSSPPKIQTPQQRSQFATPKPKMTPLPFPLPTISSTSSSLFDEFASSQEERAHFAMAEQSIQNYRTSPQQQIQPQFQPQMQAQIQSVQQSYLPTTPVAAGRPINVWTPINSNRPVNQQMPPPQMTTPTVAPSAWTPRLPRTHATPTASASSVATTNMMPPPTTSGYSSRPVSPATFVPPRQITPAVKQSRPSTAAAAEPFSDSNEMSDGPTNPPHFDPSMLMVGFQTGRGKIVELSEAALEKASKQLREWHTADAAEEPVKKHNTAMDVDDGLAQPRTKPHPSTSTETDYESDRPPSPSRQPGFDPNNFMPSFSTGRGTKVNVSAAAKERAMKLMAEVDADLAKSGLDSIATTGEGAGEFPNKKVQQLAPSTVAATAATTSNAATRPSHDESDDHDFDRPPSPSKLPGFDPNNFMPSFSTGRGNKVNVSAAAQQRAVQIMAQVDADLTKEGLMDSTTSETATTFARSPPPIAAAVASSTTSFNASSAMMGGFSSKKPFRPPARLNTTNITKSTPIAAAAAVSTLPTAASAKPLASSTLSDSIAAARRKSKMDLLEAQIAAMVSSDAIPMELDEEEDGYHQKSPSVAKTPEPPLSGVGFASAKTINIATMELPREEKRQEASQSESFLDLNAGFKSASKITSPAASTSAPVTPTSSVSESTPNLPPATTEFSGFQTGRGTVVRPPPSTTQPIESPEERTKRVQAELKKDLELDLDDMLIELCSNEDQSTEEFVGFQKAKITTNQPAAASPTFAAASSFNDEFVSFGQLSSPFVSAESADQTGSLASLLELNSGGPVNGQKRKMLSQIAEESSQELDFLAQLQQDQLNSPEATKMKPASSDHPSPSTPNNPVSSLMTPSTNSSMPPPLVTPSPTMGQEITSTIIITNSAEPSVDSCDLSPRAHKRQKLEESTAITAPITTTTPTDDTHVSPITHSPIPIGSFDSTTPTTPTTAIRTSPSGGMMTTPDKTHSPDSICIPATPSLESQPTGAGLSLEIQFDEVAMEVEPHQPSVPDRKKLQQHQSQQDADDQIIEGTPDDYLPPSTFFQTPPHQPLNSNVTTFASPI